MNAATPNALPLTVRYVTGCPNCGSDSFRTWGATAAVDRLHFCQCICARCGLVFSNPQCDEPTLSAYYGQQYYDVNHPEALTAPAAPAGPMPREEVEHLRGLTKFVSGGRVLDVGCGTGEMLVRLRELGFEPHGVEPSATAVEHARTVHGLENVHVGTLDEVDFPEESFDVVVTWHVIEHVLDLDAFLASMRRVLRPGGFLWVGTENYRNAYQYASRFLKTARGLPPEFATSSEHTFVFTARTLADVVSRRGFEVLGTRTYQPPWAVQRGRMRFRSPLSYGYFLSHYLLNRAFNTGPYLDLVARRA